MYEKARLAESMLADPELMRVFDLGRIRSTLGYNSGCPTDEYAVGVWREIWTDSAAVAAAKQAEAAAPEPTGGSEDAAEASPATREDWTTAQVALYEAAMRGNPKPHRKLKQKLGFDLAGKGAPHLSPRCANMHARGSAILVLIDL